MLRRFNEAFGIESTLDTERARFVKRIDGLVFQLVVERPELRQRWLQGVCIELGIRPNEVLATAHGDMRIEALPRDIGGDDFIETLKVVEALRNYFAPSMPWAAQKTDVGVREALARAVVDLGVRWKDGMFLPVGAEILDRKLVDDPYKWLGSEPTVRELFKKAVADYSESRFGDSVVAGYKTLERLAAAVLGNERNLENNKTALLEKLGVSPEWRSMLNNFMKYANEYARHASQADAVVDPNEAEAFLYQTGLFVRLILTSNRA